MKLSSNKIFFFPRQMILNSFSRHEITHVRLQPVKKFTIYYLFVAVFSMPRVLDWLLKNGEHKLWKKGTQIAKSLSHFRSELRIILHALLRVYHDTLYIPVYYNITIRGVFKNYCSRCTYITFFFSLSAILNNCDFLFKTFSRKFFFSPIDFTRAKNRNYICR